MNGKEKEIRRQREPECAGICLASGYGWKNRDFGMNRTSSFVCMIRSQQKARRQTAFFSAENGANKP